jgi:hypothetical protein
MPFSVLPGGVEWSAVMKKGKRKNPHAVALGRLGGLVRSEAKRRANRENGRRGGLVKSRKKAIAELIIQPHGAVAMESVSGLGFQLSNPAPRPPYTDSRSCATGSLGCQSRSRGQWARTTWSSSNSLKLT